ncbi:lipid-A-disaccharide synthase N-terminal domain-containing protein [Terrihabitans sp. B22-R8]|uniref:lipid-A-disaccharide synthase N-terminal domain-containing protein n=1 Tax=Terrihabitans sp. B22-R8 TaxID=3425128 RepID=UPI00403CAA84
MLAHLAEWAHEVFVLNFDAWAILGLIAQSMFMMRFVVQWIASERARKSVIPIAFWFFSIAGGALLLVYSIQRRDPVFIAGQALGMVIYIRNIWLIAKDRRLTKSSPLDPT